MVIHSAIFIRGFTLIDFLVSTAIFFILAMGTAELSNKIIKNHEMSVIVKTVVNALDSYQEQATLQQKNITIRFDKAHNRISLVDENKQPKQREQTIINLPKSITISFASFGTLADPSILTFYSTGTTSPGQVTFSNSTNACSIIQSLYGARRKQCS
jgi:type II secretory pathway pseudopilin PulG